MNRRNFFARVATALAVLPVVKLTPAQAKPAVAARLPMPNLPSGATTLILGRVKIGKSMLAELLWREAGRSAVLYDSALDDLDRGKEWVRKCTVEMMSYRAKGHTVFVTQRLNRAAVLAQGYGAGPAVYETHCATPLSYLADWTFVIEGRQFDTGPDYDVWRWRCRTLKDRFGDKPKEFSYAKVNNGPLVLLPVSQWTLFPNRA